MEYKQGYYLKCYQGNQNQTRLADFGWKKSSDFFFSVCFILIFFPDKQDFPKSWTVWLDRLNFCRWNSKDTVDKKFQNSRVSNLTKSKVQETPGKVTYPW